MKSMEIDDIIASWGSSKGFFRVRISMARAARHPTLRSMKSHGILRKDMEIHEMPTGWGRANVSLRGRVSIGKAARHPTLEILS